MRTSVDTSTASKCVTGIYTSNYNVTFYDMDYNNVPYTTEYAVKLTNQTVSCFHIAIQTSSPSHPSFTTQSVSSSFSSPTNSESLLYCHNYIYFLQQQLVSYHLKLVCRSIYVETFLFHLKIVAAMILVLAAVIGVIIIFIICLILIIFKHIKKTQNGRRQQGSFKTIVTK